MSKEKLQKLFSKYDQSGTGLIKKEDLRRVFEKIGWTISNEELAALADETADGKFAYSSLLNVFDAAPQYSSSVTRLVSRLVVSNDSLMTPPTEPGLLDNTLLFLPEKAVVDLGLEPNMDDKGDAQKELWFGRVWELRELISMRYREKLSRIKIDQSSLSEARRKELDSTMKDPRQRALLTKVAAHWKGAAYRRHCSLRVLDKLKFSNLRGTLVYAHGSGGCSWDNFRICRMIARIGILVIAPDGFAYAKSTAMGQIRHKDVLPLKKASDDVNYWTGDLMYASKASGTHIYSTKADAVLGEPEHYRELYEKVYQLRRSELHFTIGHMPGWMHAQGFFLGGTSEGAMTIARFDDQRYGEKVIGRFINSFGIEYCYFTPTEEAAQLGGQLDVPTLNIIGTKDQYFGPTDSIAKIVAQDDATGYGNEDLTGNGYRTMLRQGVDIGLVCVLENGVHSPCNTHDNFLRQLFQYFFGRPSSIWELDRLWEADPTLKELIRVDAATASTDELKGFNILKLFVPTMPFPNKMSLRQVETCRALRQNDVLKQAMASEEKEMSAERAEISDLLNAVRKQTRSAGSKGFSQTSGKTNYYEKDSLSKNTKRRASIHIRHQG